MHSLDVLIWLVVIFSLGFDYINGFHDTANAIATVVSTRVLQPRTAILMAACLNFTGALVSTKVARTIAGGLVDKASATETVVLAAVIAAIIWNLITWKWGIPSSSSHALIGGLCGAAVVHGILAYHVTLHRSLGVVIWTGPQHSGIIWKVVVPLVASPLAGFVIGFAVMAVIYRTLGRVHPGKIGGAFHRLQVVSAAFMAYSHGLNDAQKSMGIITMALVAHGVIAKPDVPPWVMVACAAAMAAGTSAGGWRIIRTMGHRIIRLEPVHGFAAETSAGIVITLASHLGMPVSTTHVISGSIFGVGSSKRLSAVRWGVAESMVVAWVLTLPAAATVGALAYLGLHTLGVG
jgi:PiT family inorganic phosphate transporter